MKYLLFSVLLLAIGCSSTPTKTEAEEYFGDRDGCFLLYNVKTKLFEKALGKENCLKRQPACSTFKVPLSVMAFDSGALKDENVVLKWDGKNDPRPAVNKDHDAKTWMSDSVVWFSQRLTPKIGKTKLQKYLRDFKYGNQDLTAGVTTAWLIFPSEQQEALTISPYEQVKFMSALWKNELPVSKRAMQLTRDLTYLGVSDTGSKLHGKTGSNYFDETRTRGLGWFVGHLSSGDREYVVVTNFVDKVPTNEEGYPGIRARELTKKILSDIKLW